MRYSCCDEPRRIAVEAHATLNGIDYLEVLDLDAPPGIPRQRTLLVHCLKPVAALDERNVVILGGERIRDVRVEWAAVAAAVTVPPATAAEQTLLTALPDADRVLAVRTESAGDFSTYTLRLQRSATDPQPPLSFDPQLAEVEFSFKVECPTDFDCKPPSTCADPVYPSPDIDYLAKDYSSFRRLMLDRLAQVVPDWSARTPADLGVTLVEMLAYAGDQLSYFQDAVATEAYLGTARRRTSLRRHAVLVDYLVHEGSNARTWVQLALAPGVPSAVIALDGLQFLTRVPPLPGRISDDPSSRDYRDAFAASPAVFEPMDPDGRLALDGTSAVTLHAELHEIDFYAWGQQRCCVPAGATRATLSGHLVNLAEGDVLIFEEVKGPLTGEPADADPMHRHAVRLTFVHHTTLDSGTPEPLVDPLPASQPQITEIEWDVVDALPFPLCISSRTDEEHGHAFLDGVSVARGNVILADHGRTVDAEPLDDVPVARLRLPVPAGADRCDPPAREWLPVRYRP
ncbi:MAG: putative baseplate assembly protein, partial [Gemmatimonadetes bacterium]|nr:putative baseplate assembly protein [Gemmatimonadota bacterium]